MINIQCWQNRHGFHDAAWILVQTLPINKNSILRQWQLCNGDDGIKKRNCSNNVGAYVINKFQVNRVQRIFVGAYVRLEFTAIQAMESFC